jgi:hypothetical protein
MRNAGSVLGVDVGFSVKSRSSAVCRLDWDGNAVSWAIARFRALPEEQKRVISSIGGSHRLEAAAFDGPLRRGLNLIGRYRTAERMLTRRLRPIGKPGQANVPVGIKLNEAANACARITLETCHVAEARHTVKIDGRAIVEAFPSAFMGVMLLNPSELLTKRNDRSDIYFEHLASNGGFLRVLQHVLPTRKFEQNVDRITNHDDRAAFVCALTALCVAAGDFTAVGDDDGWIILPPWKFIRSWARRALEANASEEILVACAGMTGVGKSDRNGMGGDCGP